MKPTITNGWLIAGIHRIRLSTVARYLRQGHKVALYGEHWAHVIDCDTDPNFVKDSKVTVETMEAVRAKHAAHLAEVAEVAADVVALLDAHFAS